jgi:TPR repeat protein
MPYNYKEAAVWYRKAAQQGDTKAQLDLGLLYKNSCGVEQSDMEAYRWWKKAADQGDADAKRYIRHLRIHGRGIIEGTISMTDW